MSNISSSLKNWSPTAASNQPDGTDSATIAGDLQNIQAGIRYIYSQDTIASSGTCDLGSKDAGSLTISGTTTITSFGTVSAGIIKKVIFSGILTLTYNATSLILPSAASITTDVGDTAEFESLGSGNWRCNWYERASGTALIFSAPIGAPFIDSTALVKGSADATKLWRVEVDGFTTGTTRVGTPPDKDITLAGLVDIRSYLAGCTMSTAGASATMSIAAGQCMDSTNAFGMTLAAIAKTTSAWAVGTGNGGIDTGAIANATWYHFYAIRRPDTGVVDVVFSTNATTPTLPANYTQYRYFGSGLTNGSAQWVKFIQIGDNVLWDVAVIDVDAQNPGTAAVSRTLSTPLGVKTLANLSCGIYSGTNANTGVFSSLDVSDQAPQAVGTASLTGFSTNSVITSTAVWQFSSNKVITSTASQIRSRLVASGASDRVGIITRGWSYIR